MKDPKDMTRPELIEAVFCKKGVDPNPATVAIRARLEKLTTLDLVNLVLDAEVCHPDGDESTIAANIVVERAGDLPIHDYLARACRPMNT